MESLIYDERQVRRFYDTVILGSERGPFDVDFFCVAARKKYMTQEERELTRLGDTCMMEKTPVREPDEDVFYHKLQKVDSCLDHLYSHNGTRIPRSCMVLYMNVNHTSMIEALKGLKTDIATMEGELYDVLVKNGSRENIGNKVKRLDNLTLKAYQNPKNVSKRSWIDIDIDINCPEISAGDIQAVLDSRIFGDSGLDECSFLHRPMNVIIKTHGGYHVLVNTVFISDFNSSVSKPADKSKFISVDTFVSEIKKLFESKNLEAKEIKINQNAMVPIPGTLQGGMLVIMY